MSATDLENIRSLQPIPPTRVVDGAPVNPVFLGIQIKAYLKEVAVVVDAEHAEVDSSALPCSESLPALNVPFIAPKVVMVKALDRVTVTSGLVECDVSSYDSNDKVIEASCLKIDTRPLIDPTTSL